MTLWLVGIAKSKTADNLHQNPMAHSPTFCTTGNAWKWVRNLCKSALSKVSRKDLQRRGWRSRKLFEIHPMCSSKMCRYLRFCRFHIAGSTLYRSTSESTHFNQVNKKHLPVPVSGILSNWVNWCQFVWTCVNACNSNQLQQLKLIQTYSNYITSRHTVCKHLCLSFTTCTIFATQCARTQFSVDNAWYRY